MIKPDWHAKPLSSEEEVEQVQGVFHITCRPNIKGDNIPSCVAVAAAHQLIWRIHPENWAADGRPPPGRMQHNDRVLRAHSTLGLKLARSQTLAFQARLQQRSPRGFHFQEDGQISTRFSPPAAADASLNLPPVWKGGRSSEVGPRRKPKAELLTNLGKLSVF